MEKYKTTADSNKKPDGNNTGVRKYKQTKEKSKKYFASQLKDYSAEMEEEELKRAQEKIYLKHRVNAHVEYRWKGIYRDFKAFERKLFNKEILDDKDFKKSSKYFTVEKYKEGGNNG